MKYVTVTWPEIQDYMGREDYPERCFYDPVANVWLIPEEWDSDEPEYGTKEYFDMHDCWDAIGGDWEG